MQNISNQGNILRVQTTENNNWIMRLKVTRDLSSTPFWHKGISLLRLVGPH